MFTKTIFSSKRAKLSDTLLGLQESQIPRDPTQIGNNETICAYQEILNNNYDSQNFSDFEKNPKGDRNVVFTYNNYDEQTLTHIETTLKKLDKKIKWGIIGKEVGEEKGTPHLQGAIAWTEAKSWNRMREHIGPKVRCAKMLGKKCDQVYCGKENNIFWVKDFDLIQERKQKEWKKSWVAFDPFIKFQPNEFQQWWIDTFIPFVEDDRTIYWFVGEGKDGKGTLIQYIQAKCNGLPIAGDEKDIMCQLAQRYEQRKPAPEFLMYNVPKCQRFRQYGILEKLKDKNWVSSKYVSCDLTPSHSPHVMIFSNDPPEQGMFTEDRLQIIDLTLFKKHTINPNQNPIAAAGGQINHLQNWRKRKGIDEPKQTNHCKNCFVLLNGNLLNTCQDLPDDCDCTCHDGPFDDEPDTHDSQDETDP